MFFTVYTYIVSFGIVLCTLPSLLSASDLLFYYNLIITKAFPKVKDKIIGFVITIYYN